MAGAHFLEVRGTAEALTSEQPADSPLAPEIIRIHPTRIVAFNVDPHRPGFYARPVRPGNWSAAD
jgi:pyridoxamine 5'-phosphate oxidase family protein